jgi:hypothetical protein
MIVSSVTLTTGTRTVTLGQLSFTDGNAHGYTLERADFSPAPRRPRRQELPLVGGGVVTPGRPGIRMVELEGSVIGRSPSEANALAASLAACVADQGDTGFTSITYAPQGAARTLTGTLDGEIKLEATRNPCVVGYSLAFACPDPVAYSTASREIVASAAPGTGFTMPGDATVWPDLTIVATGSVTSFRVGNSVTGQFVQLDGLTLTTGKTVTVTTRPGYEAVLVDGVNGMGKRNANSRWFNFVPGTNRLYVTVLGGTGSLVSTATFRDGWAS